MKTTARAGLTTIIALTVAACGGGNTPTGPDPVTVSPSTTTTASGGTTFTTLDHDNDEGDTAINTDAEQSYVETEAQFHQAAIAMSVVAERDADHPQVKFLAHQTAQNHRVWLAALRSVVPGHVASTIALTPQQDDSIDAVEDVRGSALDRRYVEQLIDHYQIAIPVLQQFVAAGSTTDLRLHVQNNLIQNFTRQLALARDTASYVGANREGAD